MAKTDDILVAIRADNSDIKKKLGQVEKNIKKFGSVADKSGKKAGKSMSFIGNAIKGFIGLKVVRFFVDMGKAAVKAASDLEEVTSKFRVVFGGNMAMANKNVAELRKNYAMSTREAREYLASVQDLLVPMGMASDKAAGFSGEIVKLAADLGSFNNMPTAQVMENIQAALTGEGQVMKKYGVIINETSMKQEALNSKLWDGKGKLDAVAKAQAAMNIMFKQTTAAQGDMIRTSDSYANMVKKMNARVEDAKASIGSKLLPVLGSYISDIMDAGEATGSLADSLGSFIAKSLLSFKVAAQWIAVFGSRIQRLQAEILLNTAELGRKLGEFLGRYGTAIRKQSEKMYLKSGEAFIVSNRTVLKLQGNLDKTLKLWDSLGKKQDDVAGKGGGSSPLAASVEKSTSQAKVKMSDYYAYIGDQRQADLLREAEQYKALLRMFENHTELKARIEEAWMKKKKNLMDQEKEFTIEHFQSILSVGSQITSQLSQTMQMAHNNKMEALQQEIDKILENINLQLEAENNQFDIEMELLQQQYEQGILTEQEYNERHETLENRKANNEKARQKEKDEAEKAFDKEKKRLERSQAKRQKKIRIAETIMSTAAAAIGAAKAMASIPYVGPALAAIAAASMAALGLKQLQLIKQQPLPEAADGAYASSPSPVIFGHGPEAILPLKDFVFEKISKGILNQMAAQVPAAAAQSSPAAMAGQAGPGGASHTVVHTSINLDGEEVAAVVDTHRAETARNIGAEDYKRESAY